MKKTRFRFSLGAVTAAAFSLLGQMLTPPTGRAGQYGRIDLGDEKLDKAFDTIEQSIEALNKKAKGEFETLGKVSKETQDAVDAQGRAQLELAERVLRMEQSAGKQQDDKKPDETWGGQVIREAAFADWQKGAMPKVTFTIKGDAEVRQKNTLTGGPGGTVGAEVVQPDRRPGIIPGPARNLVIEQYLNATTTTSNAVEYTREQTFVNGAAETAEGALKPESSITFTGAIDPVQTVAHWIKISRQLSMDAPALMAYINWRMRYGVDKRVEDQLINGNGVHPNIGGLFKAGNFTAHGWTDAAIAAKAGAGNKKLALLRMVIADLASSDYPGDVIMLNSMDYADFDLLTDANGNYLFGGPAGAGLDNLWRKPVVASNAIPADKFIVMSRMAATIYNREGVIVQMSESDGDNFVRNLVTLRAERRLMLAVEIPQAVRGGDLTPA